MVLAEAMASGAPAVALDAPGVREIVNDSNGRLLARDASEDDFSRALAEVTSDGESLKRLGAAARKAAGEFSIDNCTDRVLAVYEGLIGDFPSDRSTDPDPWDRLLRRLEIEWNLLVEKTSAIAALARDSEATKSRLE
jgi:hypothetical protein